MRIDKIEEYNVNHQTKYELQKLLIESFGKDFPSGRIFYKQRPHFRFIVRDTYNHLIGQVGLDYRAMNLNGKQIAVLGIIDLCISEAHRSKGTASLLLSKIDEFCKDKEIDFILLFADKSNLYLKNGFKSVKNKCKWLQIDDVNQTTVGIGQKEITELMVKEMNGKKWEEGEVDLLGYLY